MESKYFLRQRSCLHLCSLQALTAHIHSYRVWDSIINSPATSVSKGFVSGKAQKKRCRKLQWKNFQHDSDSTFSELAGNFFSSVYQRQEVADRPPPPWHRVDTWDQPPLRHAALLSTEIFGCFGLLRFPHSTSPQQSPEAPR